MIDKQIEALEKRIAELEQELAATKVQQALMDDRLLILERNRLFRLWGSLYRAIAGRRSGGLSDLRTPGDYARWVEHEQHELAAEDHQATNDTLISVVTSADSAEAASAKGDFILLLHPGDRLSPHALHIYAQAHCQDESAEFLYSDEDHIDSAGNRTDPCFKPGWSPELLRSAMYLGRSLVFRRDLFFEKSPDLRKHRGHHIPRVLYHRADAVSPWPADRMQYQAPADAQISLIVCSRHMQQVRECLEAVRSTRTIAIEILVVHHLESGSGEDMRQCVEQFGGKCIPYRGAFDFARMNNLAAAQAASPYLLFMNDDVLVRKPGWDHAIAATLARPEIGAAGAVLQYPDGAVQHAGVVVGMGDAAGHCGRFQMSSDLWPWLRMSRDVSAVTGAMFGMRSEVFREMSGFDETFPINYNDVDLCLRIRKAGLQVVCLNVGEVIHRESQTRISGTRYHEREALYKRWASVLAQPDEFYSMHLAPTERIALNMEETEHPLRGLWRGL